MSTDYLDEPYVDPVALRQANEAHDARLRAAGIANCYHSGRLAGRALVNIVGAVLTDKKITKYERMGYYSPEYRAARSKLAQKKALSKRTGNFDLQNGRMIYRP